VRSIAGSELDVSTCASASDDHKLQANRHATANAARYLANIEDLLSDGLGIDTAPFPQTARPFDLLREGGRGRHSDARIIDQIGAVRL
jgi:hypothetical protein